MKAISLWQPWAEYVAAGLKPIETRLHNWFRGLVGQRIAIHAAQKFDGNAGTSMKYLIMNGTSAAGMRYALNCMNHLGMILCVAHVREASWLTAEDSRGALVDCGNTRRFGLFLDNICRLEKPIPCKGRQGIFEVDLL